MMLMGKRYCCAEWDAGFLRLNPGSGTTTCCGAGIEQVEAKPLPASD